MGDRQHKIERDGREGENGRTNACGYLDAIWFIELNGIRNKYGRCYE